MNPFQQLIDHANGAPLPRPSPDREKPSMPAPPVVLVDDAGPLMTLLHLLETQGPMTTAELAQAINRHTRAVHGLFKTRRYRGQVVFADGIWALRRDYEPDHSMAVQKAVKLLQSLGWTVAAPTPGPRCSCHEHA